jgi:hypothetical protein
MLVINPKPKRRRKGPRKMSALQRMYFGKRRSRSRTRVTHARRNPVSRPFAAKYANPPAYRKAARKTRRRAVASRLGRIGSRSVMGFVKQDLFPAMIGASGALALDMLWPHLTFLPPQLQSGPLAPLTRVGMAVGLGVVAGMIGGKRLGAAATVGALTVTGYDIAKGYMAANIPPPAPTVTADAMNGYAPRGRLGWASPAMMAGYAPMSGYAPAYY